MKRSITDNRVKQQTGKHWQAWFEILDKADATKMPHKEIAQWLHSQFDISGWWVQMVTVEYEQARGLRQKHQKPSGFEISVSKTIAIPVKMIFAAWTDDTRRAQWLGRENLHIHGATPDKSIRITWSDGKKSVNVNFYPKSASKTQVTVQHGKLANAEQAADMKAYWKDKLIQLQQFCSQLCHS